MNKSEFYWVKSNNFNGEIINFIGYENIVCHTSRESMGYKTPQTNLTLILWPWPTTFTFDLGDLDLDPCDLDLGPSSENQSENWNFYIFDLGNLDLWPITLTFKLVREYDGP